MYIFDMAATSDDLPEPQPLFSHAEPVLPVHDVAATIRYYQETLGFPNQWIYGDPPDIGAVSWHGAHIQFLKNPKRADASAGNAVWIRVQHIDQLYKLHQQKNANIAEPLELQPWGMHQYVVKDINGYYLCFAGHSVHREGSGAFPHHIAIVERMPTPGEFITLKKSVGWWDEFQEELVDRQLTSAIHGVVAIDTKTNEAIGCAFILGDNASFYYIKDVMVHPQWQKRRIGTALMRSLQTWLEKNGVKKSLVALYTGENLENFYKQFGFAKAFGMVRSI